MASARQIEANRLNALKSTGPKSEAGKRRSRRNAVRHGLTAETVIAVLEDAEDYKAFEASVTADFDARTAVERELVLRLASLLWRLRRATAIETGLLRIQGDIMREASRSGQCGVDRAVSLTNTKWADVVACKHDLQATPIINGCSAMGDVKNQRSEFDPAKIAQSFLRLTNVDNGAFERLNRYETALWRQACAIIVALNVTSDVGIRRFSRLRLFRYGHQPGPRIISD